MIKVTKVIQTRAISYLHYLVNISALSCNVNAAMVSCIYTIIPAEIYFTFDFYAVFLHSLLIFCCKHSEQKLHIIRT